jgi:predicted dienelactone hydrolase
MRRTRWFCAISAAAAVVALAACGSGSSKSAATRADDAPNAGSPAFAVRGPYQVGYTTLPLHNLKVAVWYPAGSTVGKTKASYDQRTVLPTNLAGLVPEKYNTVVPMDAYTDAPPSSAGPFPVLLFSHGFGASRLYNSAPLIGIASWGNVVVSTDYTERDIVAQVTGSKQKPNPKADEQTMLSTLDLVEQQSAQPGSVLHGLVNPKQVAVAGHSAGGTTAFDALHDPRVSVAIGWAPVGPTGKPADKPSMIIGALGDIALTPKDLAEEYAASPSGTRFVEIADAGHNSFTDLCSVIRDGGGLVSFAREQHLVSDSLLNLAVNGCDAQHVDPAKFWPIVQHFTVAEMRSAFGIDKQPVGLGQAVTTKFPVAVQIRQK